MSSLFGFRTTRREGGMPKRPRWTCAVLLLLLIVAPASAADPQSRLPSRVLITNDNGIDDPKTHALALAFARAGVETWLVASSRDRSGTSNWLEATRTGTYRTREVQIGGGVRAYALDGTPGDCVIFALTGPLAANLPDLVISGINGGANAGDDWFGSGTIGAVRTGTYFGVPGIAVSGLVSDDPRDHVFVADWVVGLSASAMASEMEAPQYLTISLPEIPPMEIAGVEIVSRARGRIVGETALADTDGDRQTWSLRIRQSETSPMSDSDVAALARRNIAIVPMTVDEVDADRLQAWRQNPPGPQWRTMARADQRRTQSSR